MKKMRTVAVVVILIIIACLISYNTYKSSVPVYDPSKLTKEYFYETELVASKNLVTVALRTVTNQLANVLGIGREKIFIPMDFKRQENPLTCETAALRMSLNYLGVNVTEAELLQKLEFSTSLPRSSDNVWGDPQIGFVGLINGSIFKGTGYGVYDQPIQRLAEKYRKAETIENATLETVLTHVSEKRPVIVWGLLSSKYPIFWTSYEGNLVKAFPGEHARVVIGYSGEISDPYEILLMDPLYGVIRMNTKKFLAEWAMLDKMAVVVY